MPSLTRAKLMRAEARSDQARDRLLRTIDEIRARLHPSALAVTAQDELRAVAAVAICKAATVARRHPAKVIGGSLLAIAIALWMPLRRRKRRKQPDPATRV
ncbi:MAG TPA: hypothetical protein VM657_05230 [Sphingomonas sp.]|nr:hypothetical protein [Sphingomonas sp.]